MWGVEGGGGREGVTPVLLSRKPSCVSRVVDDVLVHKLQPGPHAEMA